MGLAMEAAMGLAMEAVMAAVVMAAKGRSVDGVKCVCMSTVRRDRYHDW